jgi:predicted RNA methylase
MSLKSTVASAVRSIARRPPLSSVLFQPGIRRSLQSLPGLRAIYGGGWDLAHPFDRLNGTDTSGYIPAADLPGSRFSDAWRHVYGGSQPSIVRAALRELPDLTGFTFVDLGAGKGRPALVAAGFPFQQVVGVELASSLVEIALRNVAIFQAQHPGFAPVRIVNGDAAAHPLPAGDLVVFLYNPFGREIVERVVANIEAALTSAPRRVFVIYYNPVHGDCFDASSRLQRYYAGTIPYAAAERGFGPDEADPVVIWVGGADLVAKPGADAAIAITHPDHRCELRAGPASRPPTAGT